MKVTKKKLLTSLIATLVLSSAMGTAGLVQNAKAETTATNGVESFQMYYGASVRKTAGSLGIRFTATFDETLYNTVKADANKEFGMLITNNEWVETYCTTGNYIDELVSDKNYILITESEAKEGNALTPYKFSTNKETGAITYAINGVVANVQYTHSDWSWFGVGVIVTTNGAEKTYEYAGFETGANVRTVAEVASAALEYETNLSQTEKDNLMEYVYSAAYDAQGVSKADYEALTKENKADALSGFTLTTDKTEYYATLGEQGEIISVTATNGEVSFPVRASWTSADDEIATVSKQGILTATGRGYTTLTPNTELGFKESNLTITAYTGETTLITQGMKNNPLWAPAGGVGIQSENGEVDGEKYIHSGTGTANEANYYALVPSDISSNYLAFMKSQGYNWVRSRAYFTNDNTDAIDFRIAANADSNGGTERYNELTLPANQWMSIDIPIDYYLGVYWNNGVGVTNGYATDDSRFFMYTTVDDYGMLSMHSYNYRAPFVVRTYKTTSYFGDVTLIKESETTFTVTENNVEAKFAEKLDLSAKFTRENGSLFYTVEGKNYVKNAFVPIFNNYDVDVKLPVLNVNVTLPVTNVADIVLTIPTVTKSLNVTDGLQADANPVHLVDTEKAYDIDALTHKTELENAGFDVEYSIEKRYSDGTPMATLDVAKAESGIYYYTMNVKKNGEQIATYTSTIDLYKESEGCEYENFKHSDSKYAVSVYLANTYGNKYWNATGKSFAVAAFSSLFHTARSFGWTDATDKSDMVPTEATGNIYALNLGQTTESISIAGYENISNIGYLEMDLTANDNAGITYLKRYGGYLDVDGDGTNEASKGGNTKYTVTYVLPRHTKEYYQAHATEYSNFAMAVSGGSKYRTSYVQKIENGNVVVNAVNLWSTTTKYDSTCGITLSMLIDNYDVFATAKVPMQIAFGAHEDVNINGLTKTRIYELFFIKNA